MAGASEDMIQIPVDFATNLRCIVCNGYLSVPPIVSGNNGKNVCGRCDFITYNKQERRNVIYEDVAKLMTFPCIFEKCSKKIPWGEVERHEKVCPHHTILCPKKDCAEKVPIREIATHYGLQHKLQRSNTFIVINVDLHQHQFDSPQLLFCKEKPFLCFAYRCDSFIGVSVFSLDPNEDDRIKFYVTMSANNGLLIKGRQRILPFNSRIHCAQCFEGKCSKKHHKYSLHYKNNPTQELHNLLTTKFELDAVKQLLETEKVVFKVTVGTVLPEPSAKKRKASDAPGPEPECEICKILLSLPAASHKSGTNLLETIKEKIKQCPCNSDIKDILEDFDVVDIMDDIKDEQADANPSADLDNDEGTEVVEIENADVTSSKET